MKCSVAGFKPHLNEVSLGVNRMGKILTTKLQVIRISFMRCNIYDKNSGTRRRRFSTVLVFIHYQGEAQEGQFYDFPTRNRDIPNTNVVRIKVVGEIGAGKVATRTIDGFSRRCAS